MNRFGIKITRTYFIAALIAAVLTALFTILKYSFPVHILWSVMILLSLIIPGQKAAKSCKDEKYGFPIGRAFLWSYISFIAGRVVTAIFMMITNTFPEINMPDMNWTTYSVGAMTDFNEALADFFQILQSTDTAFAVWMTKTLYIGVPVALIAGAFIKIRKK